MKIPLTNKREQKVGLFDTSDRVYQTVRDAFEEHIFYKDPSKIGCIALDREIVIWLTKNKCKAMQYLILNWDFYNNKKKAGERYYWEIDYDTFLKNMIRINYSKEKLGGHQFLISQDVGKIIQVNQNKIDGDLRRY